MNDLVSSFSDTNTILLVAAIAVSFLLASWLLRVVRFTLGPLLLIVAIVLVLKFAFGISPSQLWYEVKQVPQILWHFGTEAYKAIV